MKVNYFIPTLMAISLLSSAAAASGNQFQHVEYGTVLDVETIWSTNVNSQPVIEQSCSMVRQSYKSDLGKQVLGGLIGSGIGNAISDKDGAGSAGAVLGAIIASRETQPRYVEKCSERVVYKKSRSRVPSYYRIKASLNGNTFIVNSDKAYHRHQRIPISVRSEYSIASGNIR